jgi:hypothetical protein
VNYTIFSVPESRLAPQAVSGEDKRVFMFSGKGTVFIFGKKYLTEDQQKAIRQLAAVQ